MTARKSGLGRNLNMLLSSTQAIREADSTASLQQLKQLSLDLLQAGVYQPRGEFDEQALEELADSIKQQGVLQPLVVRPLDNNKYEIIAGERRFRASKLAGLETVPVIIREADDRETIAMALIENIQREDLNPMDEARSLLRLVDEFDLTHQEAADVVSKSRATVSNLLRLMHLEPSVQKLLEHGDIEMGHARALVPLSPPEQIMVAKRVVAQSLTVRETERCIKQLGTAGSKDKGRSTTGSHSDLNQRSGLLSDILGAPVSASCLRSGKIRLVLEYKNKKELDGVIEKLLRSQ